MPFYLGVGASAFLQVLGGGSGTGGCASIGTVATVDALPVAVPTMVAARLEPFGECGMLFGARERVDFGLRAGPGGASVYLGVAFF